MDSNLQVSSAELGFRHMQEMRVVGWAQQAC